MTDEHPQPGPLADTQRARLDFASRDLDDARHEDLAQLGEAGLILLVERLRRRLDDTIALVHEVTESGSSVTQ